MTPLSRGVGDHLLLRASDPRSRERRSKVLGPFCPDRALLRYFVPFGSLLTDMDAAYGFGTPLTGTGGDFYKLCWGHDPSDLSDLKAPRVSPSPQSL